MSSFENVAQATHVTFMCPMRFNKFPLDEHSCKFLVGSTNYDDKRMIFSNKKLEYDPSAGNTILDYQVCAIFQNKKYFYRTNSGVFFVYVFSFFSTTILQKIFRLQLDLN